MIIRQLIIEDFRVFKGRHEFELAPKKKYNKAAPIVLFGGLNGAGKTSILTAILVALYGRQSLGIGTSQKDYETFLKESIHKPRHHLIELNSARVQLDFNFANMGVVSEYQIHRSWTVSNRKVTETLKILCDGALLTDFNADQAQAFLNELIPIGVSDLFFFDGEKIKVLAEDKTGRALADAIRKLLGLDIINRLNADLTLLLRDKEKQFGSELLLDKIAVAEKDLDEAEKFADAALVGYEQLNCQFVEGRTEIDRINIALETAGGAWSKSREGLLIQHTELSAKKDNLELHIRDHLNSAYPFALMGGFKDKLLERLSLEDGLRLRRDAATEIQGRARKFESKVGAISDQSEKEQILAAFHSSFEGLLKQEDLNIVHDLTVLQSARVQDALRESESKSHELNALIIELKDTQSELDEIGLTLSRAPDERTLQNAFEELRNLTESNNTIHANLIQQKELRRKHLYQAIESARKLRDYHQQLAEIESASRSQKLGKAAKGMLSDFSSQVTTERVIQLEQEFIASFRRLARKEDVQIQAKIDPTTFDVFLADAQGIEINKNDLSAGEKQIYAIAILEALAKTSGRNLPVIIDTPLGRLDSEHRQKLGENYFPYASQQVIILSTDTEVDESFYQTLSRHVSHAYRLDYNPDSQSTNVKKGYFWRTNVEAA